MVRRGDGQQDLLAQQLDGAEPGPVQRLRGLRRRTTVGAIAVMLAGCVLSAVPLAAQPAGFAVFLAGRALQGAGLGLVPLATAVARDDLPAARSRSAIAAIGVTTAAGIGVGYPLVGLLAQTLGLYAPFWCAAALSALGLAAALLALPDSPARVDVAGALLLGAGIAGLLLVLTQGPAWGWASAATLAGAAVSAALLAAWAGWELRARRPLVDLRLLRHRSVLAANVTAFLVAVGFYPLASLTVRFAQTPPAAGYGLALQITGGVPAAETGSAISFYQLARTVAYAIASALSATVLVASAPAGRRLPADAGYTAAALACTAVLAAALLASALFVMTGPVLGRKRA